MHTFCLLCDINQSMFRRLMDIPGMKQKSAKTYKTFYYSAKGFREIALCIYRFRDKATGSMVERHYLILRCNLSIIMGKSKVLALNLGDYTLSELVSGIQKRLYEVSEFRFLNLHKMDIALWRADRIDIAVDIHVRNPELLIFMLNMAFPYRRFNMQSYESGKGETQKTESCYFKSASRRINIYRKLPELDSHDATVSAEEREILNDLVRVEIQIAKQGINNMKNLPKDKRNIENFLNPDFIHGYLEKNARSIFGTERYVTTEKALKLINESSYTAKSKAILCSVVKMIAHYGSLYKLQQAIEDENTFTPAAFGGRTKFGRLLKKVKDLGISPATIPDALASGSGFELPSLYELLHKANKG